MRGTSQLSHKEIIRLSPKWRQSNIRTCSHDAMRALLSSRLIIAARVNQALAETSKVSISVRQVICQPSVSRDK